MSKLFGDPHGVSRTMGAAVSSSAATPGVPVWPCAPWAGLHTMWLELRAGSSPGHCLILWTRVWTRPPTPACPAHFTWCAAIEHWSVRFIPWWPWPLGTSHPLLHLDELRIISSNLQPLHEFKHHIPVFQEFHYKSWWGRKGDKIHKPYALLPASKKQFKGNVLSEKPLFLILGNNFLLGKVMCVLLIFLYFGTQMWDQAEINLFREREYTGLKSFWRS